MTENNVIKQILESKANQQLRQSLINMSDTFESKDSIHKEVLDKYESMNEEQKRQFISKGWKNE